MCNSVEGVQSYSRLRSGTQRNEMVSPKERLLGCLGTQTT